MLRSESKGRATMENLRKMLAKAADMVYYESKYDDVTEV